ncbi:hypothetical protein [Paenarthrobacter sp. C1]|uniref:hypothetical protein n=1 Tax=Paenarthrobacter sp. C1 TaxID=3400220 RepID=UPI003BF4ACE3
MATAIPALAPADADTLVLAPYSESWWAKVGAMAPADTRLAELNASSFSGDIKAIGYSRSQDHEKHDIPMTGPSRLFYIEASSTDAAQKIAEWLKSANGFEGRRVFVEGSTVVIGQSWLTSFKAPEQTMAGAGGYAGVLTTTEGSMYRNPDNEVRSLTGPDDTASARALTAVMRNGFGFTEGTTWVGTSPDGTSWSGDFRSGGVDPEQINFTGPEAPWTLQQ